MNPLSISNPGMAGIQNGMRDLQTAATKIASASQFTADSTGDVAESMVALKLAEIQIAASAKAVSAMDESLGSLLDTFA